MRIGDKLKSLRISNNLTQLEVAKALDLTKDDIRAFEENINIPSEDQIQKFSAFYHIEAKRITDEYLDLHEQTKTTKNVIVFLILSMLTIFNSLSVLLLLFFLNDQVVANAEGILKPTYVNKYYSLLFLFPFVGLYLVSLFLRLNNKNNQKLIFRVDILNSVFEAIFGAIAIIFYYHNINEMNLISQNLFFSIIGVIFFILGFSIHPSINRPNALLGYRSKFTLSNDEAWYKVNVFFSYSTIIFSVFFMVINLFVKNYYFIFFMLIPFVLTILYHELLKIKTKAAN